MMTEAEEVAIEDVEQDIEQGVTGQEPNEPSKRAEIVDHEAIQGAEE